MFDTYTQHGEDERTRLIKEHMDLIGYWVERMVSQVPSYMSRADIKSAAMEGLINAANRYDPAQGVLFKTFAEHRIRGAIFDEVRRLDWFSRSMRDKHRQLTQAIRDLEVSLARSPEESEVAEAMGLSMEDYHQLLSQVSYLGCLSLHEVLGESESGQDFLTVLEDSQGSTPEEAIEKAELTREVAKFLTQLSEKEQKVIALFYHEDLSQKEIAEVLSLSEGRISQLHSQALAKLRAKMSAL